MTESEETEYQRKARDAYEKIAAALLPVLSEAEVAPTIQAIAVMLGRMVTVSAREIEFPSERKTREFLAARHGRLPVDAGGRRPRV